MDNRQLFLDLKQFWGAFTEIAKRTGMSNQSVRQILRDGRWENTEVVSIAEKVLAERKAAMHKLITNG
jgi:hypothetical protein